MKKSELVSWEGSCPKKCGKGVDVHSGINLVKIHSKYELPTTCFEEAVIDTLSKELRRKYGEEFKFMKVKNLTIESDIVYGG